MSNPDSRLPLLPTEVTAVTTPSVVMMTLAEIAKRDGVARPGVSRTAKRLIDDHGLMHERDGRGRIVRVNAAEYDHLRSKHGDPSKSQVSTKPHDAPSHVTAGESYNDALRIKTWIEVERSRLTLAEQKRELMRVASVLDAIVQCGIEIARIVDRLPNQADDLAATLARDGVHGVRGALKSYAHKMRTEIADALNAIAAAEPETEEGK
jgi:hypothetical protein